MWVFTRAGRIWSQQGSKLVGTGTVGDAFQGASVSLSGDGNTAIVGGAGDNNDIGAAWVFTRSVAVWSQQGAKLVGQGATGPAGQGHSVSLSGDGNTALVGGPGDEPAGAAWVFGAAAPQAFGTRGEAHCYADSAAPVIRRFHGLAGAATALGCASIPAIQDAILRFCRE
jgi:hypothetical protein